jgi:hypothetical protein
MTFFSDEVRIAFSIQVRMPSRSHGMARRGSLVNHPANGWAPDREERSVESVVAGAVADPACTVIPDAVSVLPRQRLGLEPLASGDR